MVARWVPPVVVIVILLQWSLPAWAGQDAGSPAVEVGIDAAAVRDFYDGGGRSWGPRVTFNLSPETALVLFGESQVTKGRPREASWDSRLSGVEIRQVVSQADPISWHVIAGGGVSFRRDTRTHVGTGPLPAAIIGVGVGERIGPHLSLRQELRFVLAGDGSELRAQVGFNIPIGRYRTSGAIGSRPLGAAVVRTGQFVWVTDAAGTEVAGHVTRIDPDDIVLATATGLAIVPVADVRRIERPDGIGNGIGYGALIGAGLGATFLAVATARCQGDCMNMAGALILGGGVGSGLGAAGGAVVDGLRRHRETLVEIRPGGVGIAARLAW